MKRHLPGTKEYRGFKAILLILWKSIQAGIMITIGCAAYLACENKYIGALLFTVALCAICNLAMALFTGKVWTVSSKIEAIFLLFCGLGNCIGCAMAGLLMKISMPEMSVLASQLFASKLEKPYWMVFVLAIFCGILMSVAVMTFKNKDGFGKYIGILTCVPVFILCGFEHSIADMGFYFMGFSTPLQESVLFILCVMAGNTIGGLIPRW